MKKSKLLGLSLLLVSSIGVTQKSVNVTETNNQTASNGTGFQLTKHTVSSGGGVITGGNYHLTSSIGQVDAGHKATGGNYEFNGGFLTGSSDLIFKNGFE